MAYYRYFSNRKCEFYPCHQTDSLNCLFCYCPLYFLDCGGDFSLTERGIKDCSACLLPHSENGYDFIVKKLTAELDSRSTPDHKKKDPAE